VGQVNLSKIMGFDWTTELFNGITLTEAFIPTSYTGEEE